MTIIQHNALTVNYVSQYIKKNVLNKWFLYKIFSLLYQKLWNLICKYFMIPIFSVDFAKVYTLYLKLVIVFISESHLFHCCGLRCLGCRLVVHDKYSPCSLPLLNSSPSSSEHQTATTHSVNTFQHISSSPR